MVQFANVSSICSHDAALMSYDALNHGILANVTSNCFIPLHGLMRVEGTGCLAPG
jgi:hypothetical protein